MSLFDTKKNQAICVLPWIHEYKTIRGQVAPCCLGDVLQGNESLQLVREQMLQGIKPRPCTKCYTKESESSYSPRIHETIDWLKKFGEPDIDHPELQYIDVRYDPTCNLKCKTCGPQSSTLWQKEKKIKIPVNQANMDYLATVDKSKLKKVYLAGGEPTYIKGYLEFLEKLHDANPNCEVIINTNLKNLPDDWKKIISVFPNLTIVCSCDAIGTLGRYLRYPLQWEQFEQNVKFVSEKANFFQFNLVASNLNSHKLFETCSWMKTYSRNINISILDHPACFSEQAVPYSVREIYIENIAKLQKFPVSVHYAVNFRNEIQHLLSKYHNAVYDESLHKELQTEISDQDSHRSLQLSEVDPLLQDWIYR